MGRRGISRGEGGRAATAAAGPALLFLLNRISKQALAVKVPYWREPDFPTLAEAAAAPERMAAAGDRFDVVYDEFAR
jgi:hypothetical protein